MDKYLIQILKEVNTIIIPGIGALTIVNQATGEVMFLPFMKFDDEKLSSYIAEKEGWSLNDAKNLVAKYVRDIQAKLAVGDTYDMYQFGSFSKNSGGEIEFTSWDGNKTTISNEAEAEKIVGDVIASDITDLAPNEKSAELDSNSVETKKEDNFSFEVDANSISEVFENEDNGASDTPISRELEEINFHSKGESIDEIEVAPETEIGTNALVEEDLPQEEDLTARIEAEELASVDEVIEGAQTITEDLSSNEKIEEAVEELKDSPIVEKIVEIAKEAIPIIPAALTVEEQMKDDLDLPPINNVKPITKKPILEKAVSNTKRKRRIPVFFWILLGLLIGGGIYAALNYDSLKQQIPFLADNSGEKQKSKKEEPKKNSDQSLSEPQDTESHSNEDAVAMETTTEENFVQEETAQTNNSSDITQESSSSNSDFSVDKNLPIQVIVGSFSEKSNAERKVKSLKASGYSPEIIGQYDGLYFVSLGSFNSMAEVKAKTSKISKVGSYWIFKK